MAITVTKKVEKSTDITLAQFLKNPSGIGSSVFFRRDIIIENLKKRYNILYRDSKSKFKHIIYRISKKKFLIHITIPSEKFEKLTYDVVYLFTPKDLAETTRSILLSHNVNFFSNSPAFVFTYAYYLNKEKMFIDILKTKINKLALTQSPRIRNPKLTFGFEKSLYFGALYIFENELHLTSKLEKDAEEFDIKYFLESIDTDEDKLYLYKKYKQQEAAKERAAKELAIEKKKNTVQKTRTGKRLNESKKIQETKEKKSVFINTRSRKTRARKEAIAKEKAAILNRKVDRRVKKISKIRAKRKLGIKKRYVKKK
jgi:hypothetical protein